jgi:predicted RNase H-like nuclease (RuvC/YqgF family)
MKATSEQKKRTIYNYEYLQEFCKENSIILIKDYSKEKLTIESIIEGKCLVFGCNDKCKSKFRMFVISNSYCTKHKKENTRVNKLNEETKKLKEKDDKINELTITLGEIEFEKVELEEKIVELEEKIVEFEEKLSEKYDDDCGIDLDYYEEVIKEKDDKLWRLTMP